MSFSLLKTQPLVRGGHMAVRAMQAAPLAPLYGNIAVRSMHTPPPHSAPGRNPRRSWPLKSLGGGLVAAGGGWMYLGSPSERRSFSIHSPLESDAKPVDGSSTLIRPASPAAPRRQTVTLVFVTSQSSRPGVVKSLMSNLGRGSGEQEKWYSWIGYFREAGYDCIQMNLALPADKASTTQAEQKAAGLADELHQQIRLSNLQRQPVLFVHHAAGDSLDSTAQVVSRYIEPGQSVGGGFWASLFGGGAFSARPAISGLIVISDADAAEANQLFAKHPKLNTLIVATASDATAGKQEKQGKLTVLDANAKSHEALIKDIERWLIREGYEG